MSTREYVEDVRGGWWNPEESEVCRGCEGSTLLRSDDKLCERCHAILPETLEAWQAWKSRCLNRTAHRNHLPGEHCIVCGEPWKAATQQEHDKWCVSKPVVCDCGRRFWNVSARATHLRSRNCAAAPIVMPTRSPLR